MLNLKARRQNASHGHETTVSILQFVHVGQGLIVAIILLPDGKLSRAYSDELTIVPEQPTQSPLSALHSAGL
jgi:hypothetical protein